MSVHRVDIHSGISATSAQEVNGTLKNLRVVIGIAAGVLLLYLGFRLLRSDETRIRELLEAMAEGFNEGSPSGAISGLDESYTDETSKVKREEVRQFLTWLYFTARDEATKEFRYRVEISAVVVTVAPDAKKADLKLTAQFSELRSKAFRPVWKVEIEATLEKRSGWKVVSSSHASVSGKRPF